MEPLQFKLDLLQYSALQKKMIIKSVSIVGVFLTAISVYMLQNGDESDRIFWVIYILVMVTWYTIAMFRSVKKRRKIYESYIITIDGQGIKRVQDRLKDLYIPLAEIKDIEKKTNNNFTVKGLSNNPFEKISIPKQIENYQQVEEALTAIRPITYNVKPTWWENYGYILSIAIALPLIGVYVIDNKIVVSVCAVASVTTLTYSFFSILKYRKAVKGLSRGLWTIPIILLSVLVVAYFKLIS